MGVGAKVGVGTAKLGLLLCVVVAIFAAPSVASADFGFCPLGTGAGQCDGTNGSHGVAVDTATGRVFVADWTSNRIDVFTADGTFIRAFGWGVDTGASELQTCTAASTCQAGIAGAGPGQFFAPKQLAVDNSGGPNQGDVYVSDHSYRMQRFDPEGHLLATFGGTNGTGECQFISRMDHIAIGPGGVFYVADAPNNAYGALTGPIRIQRFSPSGTCLGEVKLFEGNQNVRGFAVDADGNAFVGFDSSEGIRKYDPAGNLLATLADSNLSTEDLSLDPAGYLYAVEDDGPKVIAVYDPAGNIVSRTGYGRLPAEVSGLAVRHSAEGDFYVSTRNYLSVPMGVDYLGTSPPGPIVPPESVGASPVGNAKATIKARVNPEGKATEIHVEYVDDADFKEAGFASPATKSTEAEALSVPPGSEFLANGIEVLLGCPVASKQLIEEGKCLTPETKYHYRVVAINADNPTGKGEGTVEGIFTTKQALAIETTFAAEVGTDTAILGAVLNPLGIPASGYFEYIDDADYQASGFAEAVKAPELPLAPFDFGSAEAAVTRTIRLYGLASGTTYHYRLSALNPLVEAPHFSAERTIRTFAPPAGEQFCPANEALRGGASALLPDCRAYEMVSPLDKANGDIVTLHQYSYSGQLAALNQGSVSGDRLTYGAYRAFGDASSSPYTSQYIASRDPDSGWASHSINPPIERQTRTPSITFDNEFRAFSPDLCQGWTTPFADQPLAPGAEPGVYTLYRRTDRLCGPEGYETLSAATPETHLTEIFADEMQGFSADGQVAVFAANDSLMGTGAPPQPGECKALNSCAKRLYVKASGQPPLFICVLPSGETQTQANVGCVAGTAGLESGLGDRFPLTRGANVENAVSADGTRVFWSAAGRGEGPIYVRENPYQPESARLHGRAKGTGDLAGVVVGSGNLVTGSITVKKAKVTQGAFAVGQEIVPSEGIAAGTKIVKIEEPSAGVFTLTLSQGATAVKTGAELIVAASEVISNAKAESGTFAVGQELFSPGGGIPDETTITALQESSPGVFRLTLSAKVTKSETGAVLIGAGKCTEADKACTIAVSKTAEKQAGTSASHFWTAAEDGSRVIFTTGAIQIESATAIKGAKAGLYEFEVDSGATQKIAGKAIGVLGASADGARVYFVSGEALSGAAANAEGAEAIEGQPNLYLHEAGAGGGSERFIGVLTEADVKSLPIGSITSATAAEPVSHNARVSPDGLHATFMSTAPLSGYDSTDGQNGQADNEVFVYDAIANGGAGELHCASCNPGGSRPVGINAGSSGNPFWIAGQIPGAQDTLYSSRVLSDDGSRLFFESPEALVARDTNGRIDVYEWEQAGTGSCRESDLTYSAVSGGCVDLISSGQSKRDSAFIDASPDGHDVFIATLSSLISSDYGLVDIYDARVDGGFPEPEPPAPGCEGEACQGTPEAPNDPTPASSSFEGAGNVREEAPAGRKPCAKGKVRRHGKCEKKAKKQKRSHRRAGRNRGGAR